MYVIKKIIPRVERSLLDEIGKYPTTIISDALGRYGAMRGHMRPLSPGMRVFGPAVTVKTYPVDNLMCHVGLKVAQAGDVLVISGRTEEGGLWGELMTLNARRKNLAGVIVDGGVRDQAELKDIGLPVFATAFTPRGTFKSGLGSVNEPVSCADIVVQPGDIIVGDDDGVVVVPRMKLKTVLERCRDKVRKEDEIRSRIANGEDLYEILSIDSIMEKMDVEWRDGD